MINVNSNESTKLILTVEVCVAGEVLIDDETVENEVQNSLRRQPLEKPYSYPISNLDSALAKHVRSINIIPNCEVNVFVYRLEQFEPASEDDESNELCFFHCTQLPHENLEGLWESLVIDDQVKLSLLNYAMAMSVFARAKVNPLLVNWNRTILLHGPPGTGKTSLCKALAQKLAIRHSKQYSSHVLVEINTHSLFSKWFSESGKLVAKMFNSLRNLMEDNGIFVYVLIDEIESLTVARSKAMQSAEPSDALRVVNAVLTELDRLKSIDNTIVFTTSNLKEAIDEAFMDRVDVIKYVGFPGVECRYEILRQCIEEMQRCGLLECYVGIEGHWQRQPKNLNSCSELLKQISVDAEGYSGRALRKLPFVASSAFCLQSAPIRLVNYLQALAKYINNNSERL